MEAQTPIAIIGMSCRFAGDVDSPEKLWDLLAEGRSAWSEIPKDRFNIDGFHHPNSEKLNGTNVLGGHFLNEDVGLFDAQFFNLPAETAAALDPQFRLQLESTYEALESAGLTLQDVAGSSTSVFAGSFFRDYHESLIRDPDALPRFLLIGTGAAMASNRLSHFFDLRGPSMSVDTGCSTTLTALHQGCQSLRTGESNMSIVGGTNIMFNPDMFMTMSSMTLLGKDGKSFAFDGRANGYGRGEGSATVILKRLDDAIRDGDPIRAIIRDTGVNQDGKTETITTPSGEAQEALIRSCYQRAGLDPAQTTYFEAHGTGTRTGDPIEARAIASVFKDGRSSQEPLRIGSVKTNIGHTETASGVAAIIKVALALEKGQIPPSINFKKPNDKLHLQEWKLKVPTSLESWDGRGGIRRASINNFGYGGSNAHVIMENLDSFIAAQALSSSRTSSSLANAITNGHTNGNSNNIDNRSRRSSDAVDFTRSRVFFLSGKDERATNKMRVRLKDHLLNIKVDDENTYLDNLAWTLGARRSRFSWLATFAGHSIASLVKALDSGKVKATKTDKSSAAPRLGFVYTGQGAQWWAMGRELIDIYPVFKATLLDCDNHLKKLGAKWSMIEELNRDETTSRVQQLEYSVSVCAAVQIALTELLRAWGITPTAVTSHSSGEIAAAYAAGALDLESAMAIAYARGGTRSGSSGQSSQKGGMMAVGLGIKDANKYLSRVTRGKVVVACENSPTSITLSGDVCGLDELEPLLKKDNIFARRLIVDTAWHSHHMEAVAGAYYAAMDKRVRPAQPQLNYIFSSPSTGGRVDDATEIGQPAYWVRSLVGRVQFVDAFRNMCFESAGSEPTVDMVIEVGPHAALKGPIQDIMALPEFKGHDISYGSCLVRKQNAVDTMHSLIGELMQKGYPVNLMPINFPYGRGEEVKVLPDLPKYPWNHEIRHWIEPRFNKALRNRTAPPHDLLGSLVLGTDLNAPTWRNIIRLNDIPWVRDHVVQNTILYPAAGYLAMAIEAVSWADSQQKAKGHIQGYALRDVDISNGLVVPDTTEGIEVQLSLCPCDPKVLDTIGWMEFKVQSVTSDNKWTDHCKGLIKVEYSSACHVVNDDKKHVVPEALCENTYRTRTDPKDIYSGLQSSGICHGPIFRNIKSIRSKFWTMESVTSFTIADSQATMPKNHQQPHIVHPTTLDSVFQAAYTAIPGAGRLLSEPKVPRTIGKMFIAHDISAKPGDELKAFAALKGFDPQTMRTKLTVVDPKRHGAPNFPVITIDGFVFQSIGGNALAAGQQEQSWEQDKFTLAKWAPDITFMNKAYLKKQLGSEIPANEADILMELRQACLYYIYDALSELTPSDIRGLEWHHTKFYIWMQVQVALASANELAPNSSDWVNATLKQKMALLSKVESQSINGEMVCRLGRSMVSILRGEITPLEVMMEDGLLDKYYLEGLKWGRANAKLGELVKLYAHKNPRAKVLEIGAGTGGATSHILKGLGTSEDGENPSVGSYDYTDVSTGFFESAKDKFRQWKDVVRYKKLNIEEDPVLQGFEEGSYDVIVACQVLHATKNMSNTMANVRRLLKPGGKLFLMETTKDPVDLQFVFGFVPGWWLSEEEERKFSPNLTLGMWDNVLQRSGFRGVEAEVRDCDDDELYAFSVISTTAATPAPKFDSDIVFVTATPSTPETWLSQLKVSIGLLTWTIPTVHTLDDIPPDDNRVCIFIDDPKNPILSRANASEFEGIKSLCTRSKGLLWLTQGGVDECQKPLASLVPGFLRTLRQEYSGKRLAMLDLDPSKSLWCLDTVKSITEVFRGLFDKSTTHILGDFEYAEREGVIRIPRYIKDSSRNKAVFQQSPTKPTPVLEPFMQEDRPLRLTVGTTGLLETLAFDDDPTALEPLPEDFVEIEPKAFGVNFRDVMVAMGQLKSWVMGYDCAGVITRVGPAAASQGYKTGDRVSVLLRGHYASRVRIHWTSAVQIPDSMSFETAASLPTQYVAAYVSLYDNAKLQKNETVLIHSGTGGVGQAAIMLAKRLGAEVFVTVGSEEKRNFVKQHYGIPDDHIFSSRDTSFAQGIMEMTDGKGVDVVLNSLAGALLQESFKCLAHFGRFVELGKRDLELNNSLAMETFTKAVSFSSVDVIALGELKPMAANRILKDVVKMVAEQEIKAVFPISVYPLSDVEKAFRLMQAGKHMGKIVLSVTGPDMLVPVMPRSNAARLRSDASYLVVGGFGGIGRSVCHWLAEHGARNLVVVSRSAGANGKADELKRELKEAVKHDVEVMGIGCDISNEAQLSRALVAHGRSGMHPIRGIIHGGMELKDSVLEHMTIDDHQTALAPKVQGSWNLHQLFSGKDDLDFYITLSSLVGIIGYASQSNYAAGGSFQDALARHRVENGLPGVSIDLGIVKSVGYLADEDEFAKTVDSLQRHGFMALSEEDVLSAIESAIATPFAGALALGINTGPKAQTDDDAPLSRDARFSGLRFQKKDQESAKKPVAAGGTNDLAGMLAAASTAQEAQDVVVKGISKKLTDIFMIPEDEVVPSKSLAEFGVDSLVAVELRNMLAMKAGAELSIFDIMQSVSITSLARTVVEKSSFVESWRV
ncbi:putative polyketide synthase [Cladorrhinum sp. PSN259]|nr:putative polyketide synthase [Cladorrhinum sp. PSN259]